MLQQNPTLSKHLLLLLIDQYASLPDEVAAERAPLLLSPLESFRSVSLDQLYRGLLRRGRHGQLWRFRSAYEPLAEHPLCLRLAGECRLDAGTAEAVRARQEPAQIPVAALLARWPEMALPLSRRLGDSAEPFIILHLHRLTDPKRRDELRERIAATGGLLEFRLCGRPQYMDDPFFFLDIAKAEGDWATAAAIASGLGLEEEARQCKSRQSTDFSERSELLRQFVQEFENAGPRKTFEDYAIFAKSIARRLDAEMRQLEERRAQSGEMIEELMQQRAALGGTPAGVDAGTRCARCGRPLGAGSAVAFRCAHAFHPRCLEDAQCEIGEARAALRRRGRDHDDGCPVCGPPSAILVHLPLNAGGAREWTMDL
jgi:hypothetical protein